MVDFEVGCRGIDRLVDEYRTLVDPVLKDRLKLKMFDYVNSLGGEAGNFRQTLVRDYIRRTSLIDKLSAYDKGVKK